VELKNIDKFKTEMLQQGDVNRVVVINKEFAEIYIKEDKLTEEPYKTDKVPEKGPQYTWTIGSTETFERQLAEWQQGGADKPITVSYETRHNVLLNLLSYLLPIILILSDLDFHHAQSNRRRWYGRWRSDFQYWKI
jgi:AFG3 family protein